LHADNDLFAFPAGGPPPRPAAGPAGALAPEDLADLWSAEDEAHPAPAPARAASPAARRPPILDLPPSAPADIDAALDELRARVLETWGFPELRPLQEEAMRTALAGRDGLVVLPTGGGKSLCYQAPALVRPGLTVVVSPLIALMKDQLDGLLANGVPAAMMSSLQDASERAAVIRALRRRELKLLFCAPERLVMDGFVALLQDAGLAALAVDEAHCISHWGHDFRPEYRMLGELRARTRVPVMGYTATATPRVQEDIATQLGLVEPVLLVGDFDRPNLTYRVQPRGSLIDQIMSVVMRHEGRAGIVYAMRRKDVEKIARDLAGRGVRCLPYHAGMESGERKRAQDDFQSERVDVIVATVAFGMGIDRPDVRFVVHASLPKGVEQYSQETGRAGRDGLASECVLFYGGSDYHGWRNLMERSSHEAEVAGQQGATDELAEARTRLDELWNFAGGTTCRHRFLVEHFGGSWTAREGGCGACDVCLGELEFTPDSGVVAQKILSCIVRCEQRYGAAHVADVLRGADTARVRQAGHDRLSTHGILKAHSGREIRAWIDQLAAQGHVAITPGNYPTLYLTPSGVRVMKAEEEVQLFLPKKPERSGKKRGPLDFAAEEPGAPAPDEALFEKLRRLRRDLAKERAVPPYILFNDRTLLLLAAHRPTSDAGFLAIKGVGQKKAADLGPPFLAAIAEHLEGARPVADEPPPR
jgi:ATP-dependent DNA helicase RecQ